MAKHVVCRAADISPGQRRVVTIRNRPIVIFNVKGEMFALLNRCPHQGAELSAGITSGIAEADKPGEVRCTRAGEFIRCPWHGWEFDIRSGQSWFDPQHVSVRQFPVAVSHGSEIVEGPYKAETIPVTVEDNYVVLDI